MKRYRTCDRCRFAEPDENKVLWCHYGPPKPIFQPTGEFSGLHVPVAFKGWCGGWKLALRRLFKGYGA